MAQRFLPLIAVSLLLAAAASAQDLPCPEFRVNASTLDSQFGPVVASAGAGNFVVVWQSYGVANPSGILGQRFDAAGVPQGPEFQVETYTSNSQSYPSVAASAGGRFIVTWDSLGQDGSNLGVYGQRFDAVGAQGPEFRVNTYTTNAQGDSSVAADVGGNFVVVWTSYGQGSESGIFARRFDAAGNPQGAEFQVDSYTGGYQVGGSVAMDAGGGFVVVWTSMDQDGDLGGIFGQRYLPSGVAQGVEFPVNTHTTGHQGLAAVASDDAGNFVVVWASPQDGSGSGVFGQRFDASGTPQGAEFQVNVVTAGPQTWPAVTFDSAGGFVVAWHGDDGSNNGVFARRFDAGGVAEGPEFRLNNFTTDFQVAPRVAAAPNRGFVGTWTSTDQDGSGGGVYASLDCARLYTVAPCRLADTRNPPGPSGGPPLAANSDRTFPVSGICNIPASARAVAVNVTAVNPTDAGDLRLYPAGQPLPTASALNFDVGLTRANNAVLPLGTDGQISVRCDMPAGSAGNTNLVLDVFGYFKR